MLRNWTWLVSEYNCYDNCPIGDPDPPESYYVTVKQNGDTFTASAAEDEISGTINGAAYNSSWSYPEQAPDGQIGTETETYTFTLTSSTAGFGTYRGTWTDASGGYSCAWGSSIKMTKSQSDSQGNTANIDGVVMYNGEPVCAMVLANGQYMFTSAVDGNFNLDVPLDEYGQITVFAFCSGLAPFQQVIYPAEGQGMMIELQDAGEGQGMDVTCTVQAINATWVRLQGTMSYGGEAVCAMALANGQYMFTSQVDGHFSLDVPLEYIGDIGKITLFGFCSGLPPYQDVFTTDQISIVDDADSDGYTIYEGPAALSAGAVLALGVGSYDGGFWGTPLMIGSGV